MIKKLVLAVFGWSVIVTTVVVSVIAAGAFGHAGLELLQYGWNLI